MVPTGGGAAEGGAHKPAAGAAAGAPSSLFAAAPPGPGPGPGPGLGAGPPRNPSDEAFDACVRAFDRSLRASGPFLVAAGNGLVCYVGYVFFSAPVVVDTSLAVEVAVDLVGLFLWFNTVFNWVMCAATRPGSPPPHAPASFHGEVRACRKCGRFKPPRAHHCHVCDRCVLNQDHHCPWMANCVGFLNYRYFCLTCIYLTVGGAFVIATMAYFRDVPRLFWMGGAVRASIPPSIAFAFVLCLAVVPSVGLLAVWHVWLTLTGQSTIEFLERHIDRAVRLSSENSSFWSAQSRWWKQMCCRGRRRPLAVHLYDLGSRRNWERVFGKPRWFPAWIAWAMPSTAVPEGDGMTWETCRSLVGV